MKLKDFFELSKKEFWELVDKEGDEHKQTFIHYWNKLDENEVTQEEAIRCLDALFIYTHMRIKDKESIATYYPTKQYSKNRLLKTKHLWWVDHYTAGISAWSTLSWFSAKKHTKKDDKQGFAGASTHFIQGYHGHPFYIIPLMHGAWHEPSRNKDSISIEMVNAGGLIYDKQTADWRYWARKIPDALLKELPPVILAKPYKGLKALQPFTKDQIVNNIKLKRLVRIALEEDQIEASRMSQHSDWRSGKSDMGPLWPLKECNDAAFVYDPIPELEIVQHYDYFVDMIGNKWVEDEVEDDNKSNPEYGFETPTSDADINTEEDSILPIIKVQQLLVQKGYAIEVDGHMGPKTKKSIMDFQKRWNNKNTNKEQLMIDGIPGPKTCSRLKRKGN